MVDGALELVAVLTGGEVFLFAELFSKVAGVIEPGSDSDFREAEVGVGEEFFGSFELVAEDVLSWGLADNLAENSVELAFGVAASGGQLMGGRVIGVLGVDEVEGGFDA